MIDYNYSWKENEKIIHFFQTYLPSSIMNFYMVSEPNNGDFPQSSTKSIFFPFKL
jgi:hypothetical protein